MQGKAITENECAFRLNALNGKKFVRFDGEYVGVAKSRAVMVCDHGHEWNASVNNLINLLSGCPACSSKKKATDKLHIESVLNSFHEIKFIDWDNGYVNSKSKAIMICKNGHRFIRQASYIINIGSGCPKCNGKYRHSSEDRELQLSKLGFAKFIKWVDVYKNSYSKALMVCNNGHEFKSSVSCLINLKRGCPFCAKYGFSHSKPGTLYLLRSECGNHVKVGVSNEYKRRLRYLSRATPFTFNAIELYHNDDGKEIARLEKEFHRKYESAGFAGFDGATEWLKFTPELLEEFRSLSR